MEPEMVTQGIGSQALGDQIALHRITALLKQEPMLLSTLHPLGGATHAHGTGHLDDPF